MTPRPLKLLLSLHPFSALGGGEVYTANTWLALAKADPAWVLAVPLTKHPDLYTSSTPFSLLSILPSGDTSTETLTWSHVLDVAAHQADIIWVHQFAASPSIYDLLWINRKSPVLYLTNLGAEQVLSEFQSVTSHFKGLMGIEISQYAADRLQKHQLEATSIYAGIWSSSVVEEPPQKKNHLVSIGRILPHKGFDVTFKALNAHTELIVIGSPSHDTSYHKHLLQLAEGRQITFAGSIDDQQKNDLLSQARFLIASSTHRLYTGQQLDQVELLGIVLLEALAVGTIPITSNIPSFHEMMTCLGLSDFIYQEGNSAHLRLVLERSLNMDDAQYQTTIDRARHNLRDHFLWDDLHQKFQTAVSSNTG